MPTETTGDLLTRTAMSEAAPAKVNLALHVTGRRPDGYHDLDTVAVFAGIGDTLTAEPLDGDLDLLLDGPFAGALAGSGGIERNLVIRAARALAEVAGKRSVGLRLRLNKALPVGAGLGGGSADAAATMRLLARLWGLDLTAAQRIEIATALGADVPMCLLSRPLRAEGKGERLTALAGLPALPLVLVRPGVALETRAVFERLDGPFDAPLPPLPPRYTLPELARWLRTTRNGLEGPARKLAPVIGTVLQSLAAAPGCLVARMSGSGSACYGLFAIREAADRAAKAIRTAQPAWWVQATETTAS